MPTFGQEAKEKISSVLDNMATDQVSMVEMHRPSGSFLHLVTIANSFSDPVKKALLHAADDFQGIMHAMALCEQIRCRPPVSDPEDQLLQTMETRALMQVFFMDLRSIFDYMLFATMNIFDSEIDNGTVKTFKDQKKQAINKGHTPNFNAFIASVRDNQNEAENCFGKQLVSDWINCDWFDEVNEWRNGITHQGFFLKVMRANNDRFYLETVGPDLPLRTGSMPPVMFDSDDSVSFKAFSGLYSGLLLSLLNAWADHLLAKAGRTHQSGLYIGRGGTAFATNMDIAMQVL